MTEQVAFTKDGFPIQKKNHDLALPSLIAALVGLVVPYASIAAIILGFIALSQIKKNPDKYEGRGMAIAGIIIGFAKIGLMIMIIVVSFLLVIFAVSIPFFFLF